ncbi:MAG: DUF4373 domain-containing protein [Candidatus Marinimicrobia bacterium]|jgi:hypothetical protein|nr:DUF4373 domain-containing protein [Candidatus Neomarinimicrobiota bacterium]MDD5229895.1 DUF4373 domain-containing protein [Candidatus Neomarinimicrobiota bacterium]MDD5539874.1 DUF4373 domain-containing protein [Candidatus Neomarinimicrobiota bacterium]
MARPLSSGLPYFSHDTDAMSDEKVEALTLLYGSKGYHFFFGLLERIYREENQELDLSNPETVQVIYKKLCLTSDEFSQILNTALNVKCFNREKYENLKILTSNGIKKRSKPVIEKRIKRREKYSEKTVSGGICDAQTPPVTPKVKESKVKESKEKKIIKEKSKDLSQTTLIQLFSEIESQFTNSELLQKQEFLDYWQEKNPNGKKERWQMEKVFDIKRRFRTWLNRSWVKPIIPSEPQKPKNIPKDSWKCYPDWNNEHISGHPTELWYDPNANPEKLADYKIFDDMAFVFAYCPKCDKRFFISQKNLPLNLRMISNVLAKLKKDRLEKESQINE